MEPTWMRDILSPSRFIPHGHCYLWNPGLVWLHLLSDVLIAIAYFSIPVILFYVARKREDTPFRGVFLLFGLFIVSCGTTHLMSVWTLWHPAYWLAGVIKAITAIVSAYTALTLVTIIPAALSLPSPEQMRQVNQRLETEIEERTQAEASLKQLNQDLERRVEERTRAVKKSERRFRSLFESAPDFIYALNEQGVIQQVNSTVARSSGYVSSDLVGQPLVAFLSKETQAAYQSEFECLLADGSHQQEMEFVCKDGRILTMDCSCTVVDSDRSENGSESYILVLQRDITERQKIERERVNLLATLQESERRWRSFLENVQLMVVGLDVSGQVEYVNPCFSTQMICANSNIVGKNWFECLPDSQQQPSRQVCFLKRFSLTAVISPTKTLSRPALATSASSLGTQRCLKILRVALLAPSVLEKTSPSATRSTG